MSIVHKSIIHSGPIFLKAITAWSCGDLSTTQLLCLQCLEGLRYNPSFPHLAACLYFLAFCAKDSNRTKYADDVIECLQNTSNAKALKVNLPWSLLESFNGTSKCFFELVNKSCINNVGEDDDLGISSNSWNGDRNGEMSINEELIVAPPAWYHSAYNHLTAENYESLALFCLDMGLRELGLAFAIRAHQESEKRDSPDLCSSDSSSEVHTPSPILNNGDAPSPSFSHPSEHQIPSLSLPLRRSLNLPVSLWPDEDDLDETDTVFSVRTSKNHRRPKQISNKFYKRNTTVRRRCRGSILKTPSLFSQYNDDDDTPIFPNGVSEDVSRCDNLNSSEPGSSLSPKKRVRFSLSASHPPPHIEAQFGGRSNSQRFQDMALRRRGVRGREVDCDDDEDNIGALDRFFGLFYTNDGRFRWCFWRGDSEPLVNINFCRICRCIGDVVAFLGCLFALLLFCLLFLALVICIPLTWITVDGNAGVTAGTCVRLFNAFGLQTLLAR